MGLCKAISPTSLFTLNWSRKSDAQKLCSLANGLLPPGWQCNTNATHPKRRCRNMRPLSVDVIPWNAVWSTGLSGAAQQQQSKSTQRRRWLNNTHNQATANSCVDRKSGCIIYAGQSNEKYTHLYMFNAYISCIFDTFNVRSSSDGKTYFIVWATTVADCYLCEYFCICF